MINILIVDDSVFFQNRLKSIIDEHPKLNVVGIASNGAEAIEKVHALKPDIVTMDYEMPVMDGISAVKIIMREAPRPILMLSSLTFGGAKVTLDALEAGAVEFMTKNFAEISSKTPQIKKRIYDCLLAIAKPLTTQFIPTPSSIKPSASDGRTLNKTRNALKTEKPPLPKLKPRIGTGKRPKLTVIGTSTGGPVALASVLSALPANFPMPIILVQHMPEKFTQAFAERLNQISSITVKQASDGDALKPGVALLAPGGKQLMIDPRDNKRIKIVVSDKPVSYKPSVDLTFASAANTYGSETLAIVLTGMGSDGREGAKLLKNKRATIWTQSQSTCVVYGMPMSVDKAGYSDLSLDLDDISQAMIELAVSR